MTSAKFSHQNFHQNGFTVLKNFYNYETEILPIIKGISKIIRQIANHKEIQLSEGD